jgi:hypothetical protein
MLSFLPISFDAAFGLLQKPIRFSSSPTMTIHNTNDLHNDGENPSEMPGMELGKAAHYFGGMDCPHQSLALTETPEPVRPFATIPASS